MINIDNIMGRLGNKMFIWSYIYTQFRDEMIPDIYVQDYQYFDHYRGEIKQLFGSGINKIDYIGIHVRRGDYINNPFYVDLWETEYYEKAMTEFSGERFMIFSDDIEWCKQNFIGKEYSFNEDVVDYEAMNTLASCKGIIMANSSFSWWAAYLSDAVIIAPKAWYRDEVERTTCLPEWKRL